MKRCRFFLLIIAVTSISVYFFGERLLFALIFDTEIKVLNIENHQGSSEKLYLKAILGENIIAISNNNKTYRLKLNLENNIVYECYAIFYKIHGDTLEVIYPEGSDVLSSELSLKTIIKEIPVHNVVYMEYWERYKEMGFEKFPN